MYTLVLLGTTEEFVRDLARSDDTITLRTHRDTLSLHRFLESETDRVDAVVLGTDSIDLVEAVQIVGSVAPNVSVLLLAPQDNHRFLQEKLSYAPMSSKNVKIICENSPSWRAELQLAFAQTRTRRSYLRLIHEVQLDLTTIQDKPQHIQVSPFRELHDYAPIGIVAIGSKGQVLAWNAKAREITGLAERDVLSTSFSSLFHDPDRERIQHWSTFHSLRMESKEPIKLIAERIGPNGEIQFLELIFGPIREQSPTSGKIVMFQDITERKKTEAELHQAKLAAESANQAKSNFLANMSHEIRTPLGAVLGFSDLLANSESSTQDRQLWAEAIKRNGSQLMRIIDEVLDLSKIEAGALELDITPCRIPVLVSEVHSMLSIRAEEKALELRVFNLGPIPLEIKTDSTRLKQILVNVIGNAIKFSSAGSIDVAISFVDHQESARLIFDVKDRGPGLTHEQSSSLFQPFVQADSSVTRSYGGTGLGLALSRRLARALGGEVSLQQTMPGKGSVFRVEVPTAKREHLRFVDRIKPEIRPTGHYERFRAEEKRLQGFRILLVEDSIDNQVLVSRLLKAAGADVSLAQNGADGLEKALNGYFDIVLMDLQMPVLDGYGATAQLRAKGYPRPIIALTAHAMREERDHCLRIGFSEHITKPINRSLLLETIEHFVAPQLAH